MNHDAIVDYHKLHNRHRYYDYVSEVINLYFHQYQYIPFDAISVFDRYKRVDDTRQRSICIFIPHHPMNAKIRL